MDIKLKDNYLNLLNSLNYSIEDAVKDFLLLNISNKISCFKQEIEFYNKKYNITINEFEKKINKRKNEENFEEYDDYMDWKFSIEQYDILRKELIELKNDI